MIPKRIRVAIYARTSTTDRQDPENQLLDCRKYADAKGWTVVAEHVDRMKGTTESRPGLDALFAGVRARKYDVVMVWRFDRMARSTTFLIQALKTFQAYSLDFVSFTEAIDTSSPMGELIFSILAAIGSFERDLIRERVMAGLRRARSQGKRLGRAPTVDAAEVNRLRAEGLSLSQIGRRVGVTRSAVSKTLKKLGQVSQ